MMTQCYKIKLEDAKDCKPAQFVYPADGSYDISGFVTHVEGGYGIFALWEPIELPKGAINIAEQLSKEELRQLLEVAVEKNPDMRPLWIDAINNSEPK